MHRRTLEDPVSESSMIEAFEWYGEETIDF